MRKEAGEAPLIGVLALQGGFSKHIEALTLSHARAIEVRTAEELAEVDGLVIPGGESTTMRRQIAFSDLAPHLKKFLLEKPVFGTCAGLILMSKTEEPGYLDSFGVLDVTIQRNSYGRQAASFTSSLTLELPGKKREVVPSIFIRAPRIMACGKDVLILSKLGNDPVLVQQGMHLGATFHPELTHNLSIHRYFIDIVEERRK